ncbi:MAG: 16S rRNA (cytidine(1402)-2'-O)-methyltransferase [Deltaproteobacteria bacterium]|nr:16S rRNA (cytidine(1402)-2'-O)-methyltransferase [Deltaproteobacteria bacterium]
MGSAPGRLVVVATPIGNLADLSARAAAALREADLVLAEDTRRARQLLSHLGLRGKRVERFDAAAERRGLEPHLARLRQGEVVALVADAGTPTISDPGAALVRAAVAAGAVVTPVPGPCAVTAALAASGLASGGFLFLGFLPRAGPGRRQALDRIAATAEPVALFEAPQRLGATLAELAARMPGREAVVARELTKVHEELLRGTLGELAAAHAGRRWQGEVTLVLGPQEPTPAPALGEAELEARIAELRGRGMRAKDVAKALAAEAGLGAAEIYARISRARR